MKLLVLDDKGVVVSVSERCSVTQEEAEELIHVGEHKVMVVPNDDAHSVGDSYRPDEPRKSIFARLFG